MADQAIPLKISIAPFPEGFDGDMDETFQQAVQLMEATVEGAFLTGLVLTPGSALPTTDVGPVAMGGQWYFWNSNTTSYQPQSSVTRPARNYCKNSCYLVQQLGSTPTLVAGANKIYDMAQCQMTTLGVLAIATDVGPTAGADYDTCPAAIRYTVGTTAPTLGTSDIYAHEHLIEGADLTAVQGEVLSLSFLCWVNQPGIYSVYLTNGARDESYVATFTMPTASTWARIKIPSIPAIPTAGTWNFAEGVVGMYVGITMACGSQWTTTNVNQWNSGRFMAGTGQSNMASVTNNQMKITAVRLEASAQCSYAVVNSFDTDLWECIRYYYTGFNYQGIGVNAGIPILATAHTTNTVVLSLTFPRRMAKTPTVVPWSYLPTPVVGNIQNISTSTSYANAALGANAKGIIASPGTLTAAAGNVIACYFTADARL
jgi:hypothetical protein